jgi:hypothetical protein
VDVASGMLDEKGRPRREIFKPDKLHMNRAGYVIWRDALRPVLLQSESRSTEANGKTSQASRPGSCRAKRGRP